MRNKRQKSEGDYGNEEGHRYHAELIWLLQKPNCFGDAPSLLPQPAVPAGSQRRDKAGSRPGALVRIKHHLQQMMLYFTIPVVQKGKERAGKRIQKRSYWKTNLSLILSQLGSKIFFFLICKCKKTLLKVCCTAVTKK